MALPVPNYLVTVRIGDGDSSSPSQDLFFNATSSELTLSDPLWGARYSFSLLCTYRGIELDCGRHDIKAGVPHAKAECFSHDDECPIQDRVRFASPSNLMAASVSNGSTLVSWEEEGQGGWRAPGRSVTILDSKERRVTVARGKGTVVAALDPEEWFSMKFTPLGEGIKGGSGVRTEAILVKSKY